MTFVQLQVIMLQAVEEVLKDIVLSCDRSDLADMNAMLAYHMGWEGEGAGPEASGKRIRPILLLLSTASAGSDWRPALPAAAAVELLHNFSLVHDDIQDNSPLRRGRPTLWTQWGIAQAINIGDTLFTLSHLAMQRLSQASGERIALQGLHILDKACLALTQGQYLDLSYEHRRDLGMADYWPMVEGKTAALLSCCTETGALVAGAEEKVRCCYRDFGLNLGLAFQVQDDILGIWGDEALTGKSSESDLLCGKKSLPILYGIERMGDFSRRWKQGNILPDEVHQLADQLEAEGGKEYALQCANELTEKALDCLHCTNPKGEAGEALIELANKLLKRET